MPELQSLNQESSDQINLFGALSIGIGGMIGGGLFAMMSLGLFYARSGIGVSFLIAGVVALFTGYSYAKLAHHFRDKGGSVTFITKIIENPYIASWLNIILMISYIVVTSMYAYVLGAYFSTFFQNGHTDLIKHIALSLSLFVAAALNFLSDRYVSRAETLIVVIKLTIIVAFIVLGFGKVESSKLAFSNWPNLLVIAEMGGLLFLAYEGFELIANSSHAIVKPEKNIARAIYISLIVVFILYILVGTVSAGVLPFSVIQSRSDHILANAAQIISPSFGFQVMAIAAVLASLSAETATFFGTSRMLLKLSEYKHLPTFFSKNYREEMSIWGLIIMLISSLLIANFVNLESIATMGSGGFLLVFSAINITNYIKAKEIQSKRWISFLGALSAVLCFLLLAYHAAKTHPRHIISLIVLIGLSGILTFIYQKILKTKNPSS